MYVTLFSEQFVFVCLGVNILPQITGNHVSKLPDFKTFLGEHARPQTQPPDPNSKTLESPDHWVAETSRSEIAGFYIALPVAVLDVFQHNNP